uniref:Calmodulin n=1 Tax=Macrostomum lignano TaxID=282301 RepID=A0A1I8IUV1_9PLAT
MKALGQRPSEAELRDMMKQVDEDGDGNIDFAEFVKMMSDRLITEAEVQRKRQSHLQWLIYPTQVFDSDGNGLIDSAELKRLMLSLGEQLTDEEVELMMKEADRNEDGFVDFDGKMFVGDLRA